MYTIEVNDTEMKSAIEGLRGFNSALPSVLHGLGGVLSAAVERGFQEESDPVTGAPWAELSPVTLARREAAGHSGKILQVKGDLAASFNASVSGDTVSVGTNKIYATTMHFGARQGQFGRTRRGGPIPWGNIPARPILPVDEQGGMNAEDKEEIADVLVNAINRLLRA
ncbi:MAG: phage virion morphogenesis protein [Desulfovibrio sp.]|jgi:phage virion morphogenesis protein|nr:phage virion morphogenesis protein [Desulfovibrio sp.]